MTCQSTVTMTVMMEPLLQSMLDCDNTVTMVPNVTMVPYVASATVTMTVTMVPNVTINVTMTVTIISRQWYQYIECQTETMVPTITETRIPTMVPTIIHVILMLKR
ncbi:hypothetical protein DPMN_064957 [Dreissena polymorpha]|uniref:Uncharacterized protein n=1 Tax=Dreissena polymorpha TaxID=45954 RepID=A0A9D4CEK5_DREPO|nr:hypothetical protein DPMN_064957 [Dreissena polymorpha]